MQNEKKKPRRWSLMTVISYSVTPGDWTAPPVDFGSCKIEQRADEDLQKCVQAPCRGSGPASPAVETKFCQLA